MLHPSQYILIVDDDLDDLQILEEAFKSQLPSLNIITFQNSQKALGYIASCSMKGMPSAIIVDYNMPLIKGIDFLRQIIVREGMSSVLKVIWSTSPNFKEECQQAGADLYFIKPYSLQDVKNMTGRILAILR